jgi:hypothetical protein
MQRLGWHWLWAVCALWVAGCNCGKPPAESELTVAFTQPVDGQRLAAGDDADPAAAGFQYDVVAEAADTSGRQVTLAEAKLEVRLPSSATGTEGPPAIIEGQRLHFPRVTLQGRTTLLKVTVVEQGSRRTATRSVSVTVGAEVPGLDIVHPAEGQVLREEEDADAASPGYQVHFRVQATALTGRAGTLYCEKACGIPPVDFTVGAGGVAEVPVTLTESACVAEVAECYAVVRYASRDVTSARRSLVLDTVAPRVEVSSPVVPQASTTFQVEAAVGCCEDGTTATLSRDAEAPIAAKVSGGTVSFPHVSVPRGGRFGYVLRVVDSGGNATEQPLEVVVAPSPRALWLTAPATVTLAEDADGIAANGLQVDVSATTDATEPATFIEFYSSVTHAPGAPARVPTEVEGSGRKATFRVSLAEGDNTVRACVSNPALPPTCRSATVRVSAQRGSCRIVSPLPRTAQSAAQLAVQVETEAGSVQVRLLDGSGNAVVTKAPVTVVNGRALVEVPLPVGEASYQLVASCGASAVSQSVPVTRDTVPPEVSFTVSSDASGSGVLGPETRDTSTLAGTQLVISARTEPFATVKLTGCDPANSASAVADATGLALLREVTVPGAGACALSVSATDAAGNTSVQARPLTLGLTGATLALVAPAAGRVLGTADGAPREGGGLTVEVHVQVSQGSAGVLRLFRGTQELGSLEVGASSSPQEHVFTGIALEEGANVLRSTLTQGARVTACATKLLTVDTAERAIALVTPAPQKTTPLGLSVDRNAGLPGIQSPLQLSLAGASAGARVDICTSLPLTPEATPCRDGSGFFTLATNVQPFVPEFTFPDGEYDFKAVLDDGRFSESQPASLQVDSERPRVTRVVFDKDANVDNQLSLAEQESGAPVALVSVSGLEEGRTVRIRDAQGVTLFGQATVSGGSAQVPLTGLPNLLEAEYSLVVLVTDKAGNANKTASPAPLDPLNAEAFSTLRVDRKPPELQVRSPQVPLLGLAEDADSSQPGFQVQLTVATSEDVGTHGVELVATPGGTFTLTPAAQLVTQVLTAPAGATTPYTFRIQATDQAGNVTVFTHAVTVDLEPPGVTPLSPTDNATLDSAIVSLKAQVTGAQGRTVHIYRVPKSNGSAERVASPVVDSSGLAAASANLPLGVQDVRFEVTDVAGNLAVATVANVTVTFAGCDQRFTQPTGSPAILLLKDDLQSSVADLQYRLRGTTGVCKGREVRLYRGAAPTPEAVTTADAATGDFGFDVTLPDARTTAFRLEMDDGATSTSVSKDITVDILPPAIADVVPADTTLFYVAATNEAFFQSPRPSNYLVDLFPDGDGDAELSFRVTGASQGSVRVLYNGVDLSAVVTPDSDDKPLTLPITLPQGSTGTLEVVVRDFLGNEVRHSATATVDVQPPQAPTVSASVVPGAERTASVSVGWSAVGDDGLSGVPSGYDLRWTTQVVQPEGITSESLFFSGVASGRVRRASGALLPSGTTQFTLTPLPPLTTYWLQLRARDEVGNYSRFTAPVAVDNFLRTLDLPNPGTGNRFGFVVGAQGNMDGQAGEELVVADYNQGNNRGAVYVYAGSDMAAGVVTPAQTLLPPDTAAQFFGIDLGVGNAGDVAGEGKSDVVVGASGYASNLGRAFLYLGRETGKGVDPTPIEFRGTVAGGRVGITARIIGDVSGDNLGEVVLASSYELSGAGRVYLFYGKSRADWEALRVDAANPTQPCSASSTACYIPTTKADRILVGETPPNADSINAFGRARGVVALGDLTGEGLGEFTVPASREPMNRLYVFSGKPVLDLPPQGSFAAGSAFQVLTQPAGADRLRFDGFGTEALGGLDLAGGAGKDLVVSHPYQNKLLLYADGGPQGFTAPPRSIGGSNNFGNGLACADINLDGRLDIVAGTNLLDRGSVWVLFNQGVQGAEFDPSIESFSRGRMSPTTAKSLGVSVSAGDFTGDGRPDVAAGDNLDANGARVRIWY